MSKLAATSQNLSHDVIDRGPVAVPEALDQGDDMPAVTFTDITAEAGVFNVVGASIYLPEGGNAGGFPCDGQDFFCGSVASSTGLSISPSFK